MSSARALRATLLAALAASAAAPRSATAQQTTPDTIAIANFSSATSSDFGAWTLSGSGFSGGQRVLAGIIPPSTAELPPRGKPPIVRGALKSPPFSIERPFIQFKIGGGRHAFRDSINLWIDGAIVRSSTGNGQRDLEWHSWDVSAWLGRTARIELIDTLGGPLAGHNLEVAEIRQARSSLGPIGGDVAAEVASAVNEAEADVAQARVLAARDEQRPVYHFGPPAQAMNDPNGTFFADGWYHLFYQFNPFANDPTPGCKVWGQARSRDLVHWEPLPVALWPDWPHGEFDCFSGGALQQNGRPPRLFYTSLPAAGIPRSQFSAIPEDRDFVRWRREPARAVIDYDSPHSPPVTPTWRDPFAFEADGHVFLVFASQKVLIYEATDPTLAHWSYRGVLYDRPGLDVECPNFFRLGNRWILLTSPKGPPAYVVGTFDAATARFTPETSGLINHSAQYYATNVLHDAHGRVILFGWIRVTSPGHGWSGCLALPRILSLGPDDRPRMLPVPELQSLRGTVVENRVELAVDRGIRDLPEVRGDALEIVAELEPGTSQACGLRLRCGKGGAGGVAVGYAANRLVLPNGSVPLALDRGHVKLHLFVDKGVIEAFAGAGQVAEARVAHVDPNDQGVSFYAEGGNARLLRFQAWPLSRAAHPSAP